MGDGRRGEMLTHVIRYLHSAYVPFRLYSQPSPEPLPHTAHRIPKTGVLVETRILLADGSPVLLCYPTGRQPDYAAVGHVLGVAVVTDGSSEDLPDEFR